MESADPVYEATKASVEAEAVRYSNGCLYVHGGTTGQEICVVAAHVQTVASYQNARMPRARSFIRLVGGTTDDDVILTESYEAVVAALQPEIWRPW